MVSSTDSDSIPPAAALAQLAADIVARCSPHDPRPRSAPLTPQRRRWHWIARSIVGALGLTAAAGTMHL